MSSEAIQQDVSDEQVETAEVSEPTETDDIPKTPPNTWANKEKKMDEIVARARAERDRKIQESVELDGSADGETGVEEDEAAGQPPLTDNETSEQQNQPELYDRDQDSQARTRTWTIKVNGEERQVNESQLVALAQKNAAADQFLEKAKAAYQENMQYKQQLEQYANQLRERESSQQQPSKKDVEVDGDYVKEISRKLKDAIYDDDEDTLVETLSEVMKGRGNTATQNEIIEAAREEARKQLQSERYSQELDIARQRFETEYSDVSSNETLRDLANSRTVIIQQEHPDWTPWQIIKESAEYARSVAGSMTPKSSIPAERLSRIQNASHISGNGATQKAQTKDSRPMTAKEIVQARIREQKKNRGVFSTGH